MRVSELIEKLSIIEDILETIKKSRIERLRDRIYSKQKEINTYIQNNVFKKQDATNLFNSINNFKLASNQSEDDYFKSFIEPIVEAKLNLKKFNLIELGEISKIFNLNEWIENLEKLKQIVFTINQNINYEGFVKIYEELSVLFEKYENTKSILQTYKQVSNLLNINIEKLSPDQTILDIVFYLNSKDINNIISQLKALNNLIIIANFKINKIEKVESFQIVKLETGLRTLGLQIIIENNILRELINWFKMFSSWVKSIRGNYTKEERTKIIEKILKETVELQAQDEIYKKYKELNDLVITTLITGNDCIEINKEKIFIEETFKEINKIDKPEIVGQLVAPSE